jgi:hypothetical protein
MDIDITREPPVDIYRDRGKYLRIALALLALSGSGMLLAAYAIFSDTPFSERLETLALSLFVAPALVFVYYGGKLQAYKRLNENEKKELLALGRKHSEIAAYCDLVAKAGREVVFAEYEACKDRDEDPSRNP